MSNVKDIVKRAEAFKSPWDGGYTPDGGWKTVMPIHTELLPVEEFHPDLLPDVLKQWAVDSAHRMDKMPLDFFAVGILVTLGALIGARHSIQPKRNDSWAIPPNLWGAGVGRPSTKKTPAFKEAMRFSRRLEAMAYDDHQSALADYALCEETDKLYREAKKAELKKVAKTDKGKVKTMLAEMAEDVQPPPSRRRYVVADATVEKLGELLKANPMGLLLFRDELAGWLASLDSEGREQDRAFHLEGWNGTGDFSWDRIGRGEIYIPRVVLSVMGGIQPMKLQHYLRSMKNGAGDDGLLQRFQLLVWPDAGRPVHVDESPDKAALDRVSTLFAAINDLPEPEPGKDNLVRFDEDGQSVFNTWYAEMLVKEAQEHNPHLESHLVKYHSLMPSIALVLEVVEQGGTCVSVGYDSACRAVAWCRYLETHARRVYALIDDPHYGAKQLAEKLPLLPSPFVKRDINRKGWSGLGNAEEINTALSVLVDHHYLVAVKVDTATKPSMVYHINPALWQTMKNDDDE